MEKIKNLSKRKTVAVALVLALGVAGVIAYLTDSVSFLNTLNMSTSGVNITAQEQMVNAAKETVAYTDPTNVSPGDLISKIPSVAQKSATSDAAWVRCRVVLTTPKAMYQKTQLTAASLTGVNTADWTLNSAETVAVAPTATTNGTVTLYFYKNTGFAKGDVTASTLFTGVQIPTDWTNEAVGTAPTVNVDFQAIQKANVTQATDLTAANPWGSATPSTFEAVD